MAYDGARADQDAADRWRALAQKALRGAGWDTLVRHTDDGLARGPLISPAGMPQPASPPAPLHRRPSPFARPDRPWAWDVRTGLDAGTPQDANAIVLTELAGGVTSIELVIDPSGQAGVQIDSLTALTSTLKGVHPNMIALSVRATDAVSDETVAALAAAYWTHNASDAPALAGALNIDPLGGCARRGGAAQPLDEAIARAAAWGVWAHEQSKPAGFGALRALCADGARIHDAGATEAHELAWSLAAAAAYLRALRDAGLSPDAAAGQIALRLAADCDVHLTIAKMRALRVLWARMTDAFGAASASAHIEAVGARRMLTRTDPWTNMIRTSCAGFAAAVGGADVIRLPAFTAADTTHTASDQARRIARNQQMVLLEEAHIARSADPASGSFHHETLTHDLAVAAWALFQDMERQGGAAAALGTGWMQERVAEKAGTRGAAIRDGKRPILGVTLHPDPNPRAPEAGPARSPAPATSPATAPILAAAGTPHDMIAAAQTGAHLATESPLAADAPVRCAPLTPRLLEDDAQETSDGR